MTSACLRESSRSHDLIQLIAHRGTDHLVVLVFLLFLMLPGVSPLNQQSHASAKSGAAAAAATGGGSHLGLHEGGKEDANDTSAPLSAKIAEDGDVIFGGLFPMHEQSLQGTHCGKIKREKGIQRLEAMLYAVNLINADQSLLPGLKIGLHVLDTCTDDTFALEQCMDFIKAQMSSIDKDDYVCSDGSLPQRPLLKPVAGVIGAASSPVSIMVANILRLFKSVTTPQDVDMALPTESVTTSQDVDMALPTESVTTPQDVDMALPTESVDRPQNVDMALPTESVTTPHITAVAIDVDIAYTLLRVIELIVHTDRQRKRVKKKQKYIRRSCIQLNNRQCCDRSCIQLDNSVVTEAVQLDNSVVTEAVQLNNSVVTEAVQLDNSVVTEAVQLDNSVATEAVYI
ncbi:Metabotropic glutamate receptor 3 [Bulinus truncatus]|nr:Metabotropic glutamate receptor 3 [Bulinus truncatus]